jgi:hypothetical protein
MKKISKKVREEAALICQLAASNDWSGSWDPEMSSLNQFSWDKRAHDLAADAWKFVVGAGSHGVDESWAEAESVLMDGWSPS